MLLDRIAPLSLLGAVAFTGVMAISCKSSSSSGTKFSWDEDLAPLEKPAEAPPPGPPKSVAVLPDGSFCEGSEPGTCFSLVLRVPTKDLLSDFGLSTLALASQSQDMLTRLDEACATAWQHYQDTYRDDALRPLRQKLILKVQKMRCAFVFMTSEYLKEDLPLNPNEIGISARLTKFDIVGKNTAVEASVLSLAVASTVIQTDIRSVFVYGGKAVGKNTGTWDAVKAFTYKPVAVKQTMDRDLTWNFDRAAVQAELDKLGDTASIAAQGPAVKAWIDQAKSIVKGHGTAAIAASGAAAVPLSPAFALVGMGYGAYKAICSENAERCKLARTSVSKGAEVSADMEDLVPSSEVNEAFRMAVIKSVEGILDKVLETADKNQLTAAFDLK